jgi:hypothetical protein
MKKLAISVLAILSTACSAGTEYAGEYKRVDASSFEVQHNMNTSVTIERKNDDYLITTHSGYGNVTQSGKMVNNQLVANDLVIVKQKSKLKMHYEDAPEVIFTFVENK